jgi:hypothetical protein
MMAVPNPFQLVPPSDPQAIYPPDHDHEIPSDPVPAPPIFLPLPETDIGQIYRGDTVLLPIWVATDRFDGEAMGAVVDLTGASLWFTAKLDLDDPDTLSAPAVIQRSTAGSYRVWIDPSSTSGLDDDTTYLFDVQVRTGASSPRTITVRRGIMKVVRDVTRATA